MLGPRFSPRGFATAVLAALLVAAAFAAEWTANPRVTLQLERVTCAEAVDHLSKATGVPVQVTPYPFPRRQPRSISLDERYSFNWRDVTLSDALRDLGARYHLHVRPQLGGVFQLQDWDPDVAPPTYRPAGLVERNGFRVGVREINLSGTRPGPPGAAHMSVSLSVQSTRGDVLGIAGLVNVIAKDDRGTILVREEDDSVLLRGSFGHGVELPDTWVAALQLPPPHPAATRLEWIEGEVIVYRRVTPLRLEVPLPLPNGGGRAAAGEISVEVVKLTPGRTDVTDPILRQDAGPGIETRITYPADLRLDSFPAGGRGVAPALVGASGRIYPPLGSRGGTQQRQGMVTAESTWQYAAIDEPLVRVVVHMLRKEQPETALGFRLRNIPLPRGNGSPGSVYQSLLASPLGPGNPLYQQGGAVLVSRVLIGDRPAPSGKLYVGLGSADPKSPPGIDWFAAEVGKDGVARVPDVKPGSYRLFRVLLLTPATVLPEGGAWHDWETRVDLAVGKETVLPPLRWSPPATRN